MTKILIAAIHPDEWNQYIPFNSYISQVKNNYDYIIAAVSENAAILLSEADEFYTVKNSDLNEFQYPAILDTGERSNHNFVNTCVDQIINDFKNDDLTFLSWQPTKYHEGIINSSMPVSDQYRIAFKYAQDWYKSGKLIYPTEKTYNRIKEKYSNIINDKTFVILSRNFKNKALLHNSETMIPNFKGLLKYLPENGIRLINIGFPPVNCSVTDNYFEINEPLTQDELVSIFYLTNGAIMQADAGGFLAHFASNIDSFILTHQWTLDGESNNFEIISHKNKTVNTTSLIPYLNTINDINQPDNFEAIKNILFNHITKRDLKFSKEKKITYVNYKQEQ